MIKYYDDIFDKYWVDEAAWKLINGPWHATNVANRSTWPYKAQGSHRLLGASFFPGPNRYHPELTEMFMRSFEPIMAKVKRKMKLKEIATNLQFKGMDGTDHQDGYENESSFILMLSNEIISCKGGEFISGKDKVKFKHGRVIEIKASQMHRALAFKKAHVPRMSVKYIGVNL